MEFPGNEKLMIALASALFKAGYVRHGEGHTIEEDGYSVYNTELHRTYAEWNEAVALYEKVLEAVPCGRLRDRAMDELSQLYLNLGEYKKGEALAESAPSIWNSLELLLSAYLWLDQRHDEAFAALDSARENFLKFIKVAENGVARYTAPMVRLAEEGLPCDIELAWQDYRTTAEDWPWYNIPEKHQVKAEMQQDPRWAEWVAKLQE